MPGLRDPAPSTCEPQLPQNSLVIVAPLSAEWKNCFGVPCTTFTSSALKNTTVAKLAPVARRHSSQWQFAARTGSPVIS